MAIPEIDVETLRAHMDADHDLVLIDVREDDEWTDGHVSEAVHVPLGTVPDHLDRFTGSPTYVICKAGGRSLRACEFAAAQGHDVVNVAGGMMAWEQAGHDIDRGG